MVKFVRDLLIVLLGNVILALAVGLFLLPNEILTGGIAGVAILLAPFVPLESGTIVMILSLVLLVVGWAFLGTKFMLTTIISSLVYPSLLMLVQEFIKAPNVDPLLASLYGGLLGGVGVGLVIKMGSSTGGMDIPPLIIHHLTNRF